MVPKSEIDLLCQALPSDVTIQMLRQYGKPVWWEEKPKLAIAYSLRKCPRINLAAYLESYPDVKQSGLDPVLHFVRDGLYEGRKLRSWHPLREAARLKSPKVSVVIPNYNNAIFLEKCVSSVISQSLSDIEIIIVDDGSQDNSLELIRRFERTDGRIKVIQFQENRGTHLARKSGVLAATGDYVMFLDSDDFYMPSACEKAYGAVSLGYDIGVFNTVLINHGSMPAAALRSATADINRLPSGRYDNHSILRLIFDDNKLPLFVAFKIYLRELIQAAFAEMADGKFIYSEDQYEFLVIAHKARNLIKINDNLYNYSMSSGLSQQAGYGLARFILPVREQVFSQMKSFCLERGLDAYYKKIMSLHLYAAARALRSTDEKTAAIYFLSLEANFGPLESTLALLKEYYTGWNNVTKKIVFAPKKLKAGPRRKVGLFYPRISPGGVETTIQHICRLLPPMGFKIVLFLQEKTEMDLNLAMGIEICYLPPVDKSLKSDLQHLKELCQAVVAAGIDLMLDFSIFSPMLVWRSVLFHFMGLPLIGLIRLDHNHDIIQRRQYYAHASLLNTMRCLDKLVCLSISSELYFRMQGVDSVYIANTIKRSNIAIPPRKTLNKIIVIGRLDEKLKRINECLKILHEVVKELPSAMAVFVGDFENENSKRLFYQQADKYKLLRNIEVTGWLDNVLPLIDSAKALLSTSYLEGFPNAIAEAQARGVPVVMYNLDIMLAKDNESILAVPQSDFKLAARKIIQLLSDDAYREKLSHVAARSASLYNDERFTTELIGLIDTFDKQSAYRHYAPADYACAIKSMYSYAGKGLPN